MNVLIALVLIALAWSVWGYVSSQVEQAQYSVVSRANGYEVRVYPKHIVAQTTVDGPYDQALSDGFRIVAGYIFGANAKKQGIAMTAPVLEAPVSQQVAMTAPVLASVDGGSHVISFGMPRSYTLDTLPTPTDSRVRLVEVPEKKMAVLRFTWWRSTARIQQQKAALLAMLARDGVTPVGSPLYAGYSAPWTPPWMTRNEILVEIH